MVGLVFGLAVGFFLGWVRFSDSQRAKELRQWWAK